LIPNMPGTRLEPLIKQFIERINQNRALAQTFAVL